MLNVSEVQDQLKQIVDETQERLDAVDTRYEELLASARAEKNEARQDANRALKALKALTGESLAQPRKERGSKPIRSQNVSDETSDAVLNLIKRSKEPMTVDQIKNALGVTKTTAQRAVNKLRNVDEEIRLHSKRGGAYAYVPMDSPLPVTNNGRGTPGLDSNIEIVLDLLRKRGGKALQRDLSSTYPGATGNAAAVRVSDAVRAAEERKLVKRERTTIVSDDGRGRNGYVISLTKKGASNAS